MLRVERVHLFVQVLSKGSVRATAARGCSHERLSADWGGGKASSALSEGGQDPSRVFVPGQLSTPGWCSLFGPLWVWGPPRRPRGAWPGRAWWCGTPWKGTHPEQPEHQRARSREEPSTPAGELGASTCPAGPGTSAHPTGEPRHIPPESSQLPAPATAITLGPATSSELLGSRECTDTTPTSSSLTASGRKIQLWPKQGPFTEHRHFGPAQLPAPPDHSKNPQSSSFLSSVLLWL